MTSETPNPSLPAALVVVKPSARSAADRVYQQLREELLAGLLPYGERLIEEQLAARFCISRTPIREALRRLEADGHIAREPGGGTRPIPPRVSTMRELYDVRIALEELVVTRAATASPNQIVLDLIADWDDLRVRWPEIRTQVDLPDFVHADEAFHERLATASGNQTARRHLREINERIRVMRIHDFTETQRIETTIVEHLEIARAVAGADVDAARRLVRAHVEHSARVVDERVGALLARLMERSEAAA